MKNGKIWWLWVPVIAMAIQLILEIILPGETLSVMMSEEGPHETLQSLVAGLGFLVSLRILLMPELRHNKWLLAWIAVAALGCFYISGEEISWGQTYLKWHTPDHWAAINNQDETNLHNTSSWLDQKPRMVLEIGILIGGIIVPLLRKYKPALLPQRFRSIYPASTLCVTAIILAFFKISAGISRAFFHVALYERVSEVNELYIYYFVLLYLLDFRARLKAGADQKPSAIAV